MCVSPVWGNTGVLLSAYSSVRTHHIVIVMLRVVIMLRRLIWSLFASSSAVDCSVLIMFQVAIRTLGIEVAKRFAIWRRKLDNFTFHEKFPRH